MKILIHIVFPVKAWQIPDAYVAAIRARFPRVDFVHTRTLEEARAAVTDVDACFAPRLTSDVVAAATRLRWVHSSAAAVTGLLPLADLAAREIPVTNSRGVQAVPIAEQVLGGLLVLTRKIDRTLDAQHEHRWIQNDLSTDWPGLLHGRRMTIIGLGTIGQAIATRAHAFGMTVTGVRRHADRPRPRGVARVVAPEQLADALTGCDVLVLAAPDVPGTQGMIGAAELARLERGAILANVARAQIVDSDAMVAALADGQLGGAVLDVFDREPLDAASPLWSLPNVVLTPHSAGFRATHWDDVTALFGRNLRRFLRGEPLLHVVDPLAGY